MKIIVLSSHTPSLFWFRIDMMRAFIKTGASIVAVGQESENIWGDKFAAEGIAYRQIPVSRNGLNILADIKTFGALTQLIREIKPDKIFTYQAKTIVYGSLAARIVDKHIEVYPMMAGLGSILRSKGLKNEIIKCVLNIQYSLAFRNSCKVIFQNSDDKDEIVRLGLVSEEKTALVHGSGVNVSKFIESPLPSERKAILYIGRLIADKGVREYLSVAKKLKINRPETRCILVGPFDTNPSAITVEELQPYIDNGIIEYFGEQKDVRPYIKQCSVYVLPSYHEGTPKSVLEAMAMGRPIVTSDAPGCRETVVNGKNGFLVPVKDVDALENAIVQILDNENLAASFGKESRKMAENIFDVNKVNADIMKIMKI
ncbi:glycosyltransferase family 4 protein [Alistipes shahii]|mgnify:CR=1 FL=1|nr:glycosyltransferase family 4 protein [Alistipes shahii]UWN69498.1 glycosyltransferase family 4 protein [Alistipes shahii WAL 8301]